MPLRRIPFVKAQGLGNDFLIIEEQALEGIDRSKFAVEVCDRHAGIGADGLVVLGRAEKADATFRFWNGDGSEATLSGNALRCVAALIASRAPSGSLPARVTVETRVGVKEEFFLRRDGAAWIFRTVIGEPTFGAAAVPFLPAGKQPLSEPIRDYPLPVGDVTVPVTVLWMGNPQCIVLVEDFETLDWMGLGAEIERHPYFPDRVNVGFARVATRERIEARFWERGAGHTLASGTGACACAVAAHLAGKSERRVTVSVERGDLEVNWREDGVVELTGPAEIVAQGEFLLGG